MDPGYNRQAAALTLAFVTCVGAIHADDNPPTTARLSELRAQISDLENKIDSNIEQRQIVSDQLKEHDLRIAKINQVLRQEKQQQSNTADRIQNLRQQNQSLQNLIERQRSGLAIQLRTAYQLGRHDYLRLLLHNDDSAKVSRLLTYHRYFNRARVDQIQHTTQARMELLLTEDALARELDTQRQLSISHQQDREHLARAKKQRAILLAQLDHTLGRQRTELSELRENAQRLSQLVEELRQRNEKPVEPINHLGGEDKTGVFAVFSTLKGKLPSPVAGRILQRFGKKVSSDLNYKGIILEAAEGAPVQAVAPGRVVFSDWLRGFGMLLIIDHGHQYMSLYGHNTALYKDTGDWVDSMDTIASVGNSGGAREQGLYFELRHEGKPIDPTRWFRR